jgi:hypothetical protein
VEPRTTVCHTATAGIQLSSGLLFGVMKLSSIELALVAELNLEMARAYDEVADDLTQDPVTRRVARKLGSGYRERARSLQLEARCLGAEPSIAIEPLISERSRAYTGPDRRHGERRVSERRSTTQAVVPGAKISINDRRIHPDRRQRERRRPESLQQRPA